MPSSSYAQKKGKTAERLIHKVLKEQLDPKAMRVAASGAGLDKNDILLPTIGLEVEVKNMKGYRLPEWIEQLERQRTPVNASCIIAKNIKEAEANTGEYIVVLKLHDFIKIAGMERPDFICPNCEVNRDLNFALGHAKASIQRLMKLL